MTLSCTQNHEEAKREIYYKRWLNVVFPTSGLEDHGKNIHRKKCVFELARSLSQMHTPTSTHDVAKTFISRNLDAQLLEEEFQALGNPLSTATNPS